ncbi:MAG: phosphopentomutase, partial [Fimbriimonadaceae bacterium]|nr:phosphopentomutase [Fimbriimonadaceae bacterium]
MKRVILVVLDGCGAGAAPDHAAYKDGPEAATLKNVWKAVGGFHTPTLAKVGFLAACRIAPNIDPEPGARYGRLRELSQGKDSVTGHWEMMGIITDPGFPTYPDGFPLDLVKEFEKRIGLQVLGNRPASGTKILDELGEQHVETRCPILYTSADSVFQIACHEEIYPIEELYGFCEVARELLVAPHNVSRVIARPFVGSPGKWVRTERRKDYPLAPPRNWTDEIGDIFGIGVVPELFAGRGFRQVNRTQSNREHAEVLFQALETDARFIFANFEDFD